MIEELAKVYDPKSVEVAVSQRWQEAGAFDANPADPREKFCIVIPPPNVTSALHVGHALDNTLQDVLIRFKRMCQFNTLWMPGTDHAGIATQTVVEKRILDEEGKRRTDFQRDEFVARIQAWKDEYESRIINQLKRMGCSCDWRRTRFTMDEVCAAAVRATFFKLFSDGLIYRGKRLVNWDVATQTVLADDEVEYEEVQGHFWYLRYPLEKAVSVSGKTIEHVTVATTRPETMLGDTAVAMNPADPRAKFLLGKNVCLPIVGRLIPIIADDHVVLPNPESDDEKARFSTGFLKVTPAHDPDDYEIGLRHGLPIVNVMAPDGTISHKYGWTDWEQIKNPEVENLLGMDRFEARQAVVEWFRTENLLEDVRPYTHQVGHSYRSHVPIEPYLSDQWYVAVKKPIADCRLPIAEWVSAHPELVERKEDITYIKDTDIPVNSLAGFALAPLLDGKLKFTPDRYANTYRSWLENLRDWPISRQLWWGHQIPVWSFEPKTPSVFNKEGYLQELQRRLDAYSLLIGLGVKSFHVWGTPERDKCYIASRNIDSDKYLSKIMDLIRIREHPGSGENSPMTNSILPSFPSYESSKAAWDVAGMIWKVTRDPDVLDTWFSSALWPFSTMGWPAETAELKKYYPTDVLCTAREIITLWVSRMVMMGQYCIGDIPFSDVFIHAMIQDGEGRKMSKSLGNGIDPLDIIDSHGADAMRFTLVAMTTQTQDVRMPVEEMTLPDGRRCNTSPKFDIGRNFCNKLWNASRFVMGKIPGQPAWGEIRPTENLSDAWILSRLNATIRDVTLALDGFRFNEMADTLYHFIWDDFCDWYLEIAKARINAGEAVPKAILSHCLDIILRLLHPVAPFITEAIWQRLNTVAPLRGPGDSPAEPLLVKANWPYANAAAISEPIEKQFTLLQDLIRQVRDVRHQHNVQASSKVDVIVETSGQVADVITGNVDLLRSQANLGKVTVAREPVAPPANAAAVAVGGLRLFVLNIIDRDAELARLQKQADTLTNGIRGIEAKLGNGEFLAKAPAAVVQHEQQRLEQLRADLTAVEKSLAALK